MIPLVAHPHGQEFKMPLSPTQAARAKEIHDSARENGPALQESINQRFISTGTFGGYVRNGIAMVAAVAHTGYPQYDGRWSGPEWRLACIRCRVVTKQGVAFEPGDITLVRQGGTAYSVRNATDTGVRLGDLEFLS